MDTSEEEEEGTIVVVKLFEVAVERNFLYSSLCLLRKCPCIEEVLPFCLLINLAHNLHRDNSGSTSLKYFQIRDDLSRVIVRQGLYGSSLYGIEILSLN